MTLAVSWSATVGTADLNDEPVMHCKKPAKLTEVAHSCVYSHAVPPQIVGYYMFSVTRDREGAYNLRKHTGRWITGTNLDDFNLALVYANPLSAHEDDLTR